MACPQMQAAWPSFAPHLAELGIEADLPVVVQQLSEQELLDTIGGFDGVIAGDEPYTRAVLEKASRLRILSKWGVGVDNIDWVAATDVGIAVTNTPGVFDAEVADVAVGYLILLTRNLHRIDTGVRGGDWPKPAGRSLAGLTLGIIGFGGTGTALARRAVAMDMSVIGHDIDAAAMERARQLGHAAADIDELVTGADAISLHCPLTTANRHLLDHRRFAHMRPAALVVNTARGPLIDEAALVEAIRNGQVAGAALDVFEEEPLDAGSPLRTLPNVILGSHNASNTDEAVARTSVRAVENLLAGLGLR